MNILLITTLYPGYPNQSRIKAPYAVHQFAKEWIKDNKLNVIRIWPHYSKVFNCFEKSKKVNDYAYKDSFILDGVNISRIPILKTPKIDYGNKKINKVANQIIKGFDSKNVPDIIICDILNPSIYIGKKVAEKTNSKLVASLHNSDIFYLSNRKNYNKYLEVDPYIDKIVFRSNKIEEHFLSIYNGTKTKNDYLRIPFGIDKKDIIERTKLEEKILNPNKIIMVASSLKRLKKIDVLIKAFSRMENRSSYVLKVIGDGPEREALENLVDELDCKQKISFLGEKEREEVLGLMGESEIFAMVSSPETFGLVYVEAMAKGCITIGSKGEGIDGVIINDENGYLCSPGDVEDLTLTLEKVITLSTSEKERIIKNAVNTASILNYEDLAEEYLQKLT